MKRLLIVFILVFFLIGNVSAVYIKFSPDMTSNTAPSPNTTNANTEYSAAYAAWHGMDNSGAASWASTNTVNTGPWWWRWNASYSKVLTNYTVYSRHDDVSNTMRNWTLSGSNDAITWTTLDTQVDQTWASTYTPKSYPIVNTLSFTYYNFSITRCSFAGTNNCGFGDVVFYETLGAPVASFTPSNTTGTYPPTLPVNFTDTSTNTPTSWGWNFTNVTGNNTPVTFATTQFPTYAFGIGNFSILLNATNAFGSGISAQTTWINVSAEPVIPLVASFTQSVNPSTVGQAVTFTDTSTGSPTTWNWTIGGVITNTTQNAAYVFPAAGVYNVNLTVTNATGSISSSNETHTVVNASGLAPLDIWMLGAYIQTFHLTDSSTGLPIATVTLTDTLGSTNTTIAGTGILTEPFGPSTVTFVATGYSSRAISYFFDSDATWDVQLTPASTAPSQNTWYTPWQVRIRIVDYHGIPLSGVNVTANYVASTLPSTDTTWLVSAFGISQSVANDMLNSSVAMMGSTDDNGGLSFTMFKSLQYRLTITNATVGVSSTKTLYPSDQEYVIYVRTTGQGVGNNTLAMRNGTLPWYSLNSTHISLNMTYVDTSLCTSGLTFRVWFRDNGTEVHNTTWTGFGASYVYDNHTIVKAPIGTEYLWGYNATTVC